MFEDPIFVANSFVMYASPENRRVRFQCCRDHGDRGMDQLVTVLFTDGYFQRTEESVSNVAEIIEIKAWINRYLATGDLMASLSYLFRIGRSTTSAIIKKTCEAISSSLKPLVLAKPDRTKWLDIAEAYYE
ncbi:hypothetical protein TNCV_4042281 [Trichonephila clavipes]|nr:hypothetical protein TNCV_4042281 [Trichonephila clavipes]